MRLCAVAHIDPLERTQLGRIIGDINPTLRGWYGYFQHATPGVFRAIGSW